MQTEMEYVMETTVVRINPNDPKDSELDLHYAAFEAVAAGIASELITCPQCGTRQGVEREVRIRGTAFDFNASVNVKLRCGHWLV